MKITILTLFPNMIKGFIEESIIKRAQEKKLVEIELVNLRDFAIDEYGTVDDKPYGGGAGMVLRVDVIQKAITQVKSEKVKGKIESNKSKVILTSAKGIPFIQKKAQEYSKVKHLIIIAGHYEGVDERVLEYVNEEVSLGDFVMTGGEITAVAITDAIVRLLPGVLKKDNATQEESFFSVPINRLIEVIGQTPELLRLKQQNKINVQLLEYPHYTRPEDFEGKKVPEVLLKGNHKLIDEWRLKMAYEETLKKRPDLLT